MMRKVFVLYTVLIFLFSGQAFADFVNNGDGTVTDTSTGLMWQQATAGSMDWQSALTYCENLSLAGHDDWRLPDRNELQSLVDYSRYYPSIDTGAFPGTVSSNYWSSTTYAGSTSYAWRVYFYFGHVYYVNKSDSYYVRAVRSGQGGPTNQPPTAPVLSSPSNNAVDMDPNNIILQWNPSTDPDGDAIEYCVTVNEDGDPDDIPVFTGCDNEIFTSGTSLSLNDYNISLEPGKTYFWAVWARDENGNWSEASGWWGFATAPMNYTLINWVELLEPGDYSWADFAEVHTKESLFSIISNCRDYVDTYDYETLAKRKKIKESVEWAEEAWVIDILAEGAEGNKNYPLVNNHNTMQLVFTPWADGIWNDEISNDPKFNTVYKRFRSEGHFEVISYVDEDSPIFVGTSNTNNNFYFFTYRTKELTGSQAGTEDDTAVDLEEWIDYLKNIVAANENKRIDTLTIFAHGKFFIPGLYGDGPEICMSEGFHLKPERLNDQEVRNQLEKLRNILSDDASILLFVCWAGAYDSVYSFVQTLADITDATVYANSDSTGGIPYTTERMINNNVTDSMNWTLDVVRNPANYSPDYAVELPVESEIDVKTMFPGGLVVEIEKETLNADGKIIVTTTLDNLDELGINTDALNLSAAYDISFEGTDIVEGKHIKITLPYDVNLSSLSPADIQVKYWDITSEQWLDAGISDVVVDEENHFVSFLTTHTTVFAVLQDQNTVDDDGDGYTENQGDCDDTNNTIHPGATEVPYDGVDQDCDGADLTDVDGDGYDSVAVGGNDCDDNEPSIHPGATEIPYDDIDQDCNGVDLKDVDGDGYDATEADGDDCNDNDAIINPGATEICGDDIDNNCDGQIDEGCGCEINEIPGDLDGDCEVDSADYTIFRSTLGKCSGDAGFIADADYDGDGCITYADYRIWYGYYRNQ